MSKSFTTSTALLCIFITFARVGGVAGASDNTSGNSASKITSTEVKLKKLERRLHLLEQQQSRSSQAIPLKQSTHWPIPSKPQYEGGVIIKSEDGNRALRINGLLQADQDIFFNVRGLTINDGTASHYVYNANNVDRLWMRRVRPMFYGMTSSADFLLVPDFGQGQSRLFDAFIDIHYLDWLQLAVGKQKSLIAGLERLKRDKDTLFVEYAYTSTMAPNREIGLMFHGGFSGPSIVAPRHSQYDYFTKDWLSYQIGIFSGTADETNPGVNPVSPTEFNSESATLQNKGIEARLFMNPFLNSNSYLRGLGIGIASGVDTPNNATGLPAVLSIGLNSMFSYVQKVAANGKRVRIHPQAYWFVGSCGIIGEWTQTSQSVTEFEETDTPGLRNPEVKQKNTAGMFSFIYNLTGEHPDFNKYITPNKPFIPLSKDSWGAFQLTARYTWLNMDPSIFSGPVTADGQTVYPFADPRISIQHAQTFGIGLTWFLSEYIKISTEYDRTIFVGGCSTGAMSAPITPGCLTAGLAATASTSQVINRPDEQVIFQRFEMRF